MIVYMINPYTQVGSPHIIEHQPVGQAFLITSPYERYPENSIPATAIKKITLSAKIFFMDKMKQIKYGNNVYNKAKKSNPSERSIYCIIY